MNKLKKLVTFCGIFDAVLLLLFVVVRIKLTGSFKMPEMADYLLNLQLFDKVLIGAIIVSAFFTIIFAVAAKDVDESISYLYKKLVSLEKNADKK